MVMLRNVLRYLNPVEHLGHTHYSFLFPLFFTLFTWVLSEFFAYVVVRDPMIVGLYVIYISAALIIYFAFRDGIRGGVVSTLVTVGYYFYIIDTRNYTGDQFKTGIETSIVLGLMYLTISGVIGWLKQKIDTLIEQEADEKKRLQTIIAQLPVGVMITDQEGRVVQTNKQLDRILGMTMSDGLVAGKDIIMPTIYKDKRITPSQSPLALTLSTGKPITDKEYFIKRPDGKHTHINVSASAIHNKRGKIIAAASIVSDITQQKELEARKDDFVNMASHELKTPVTSLKLYIDILAQWMQKYDDEKAKKTVKSIKNQTEKLQELISDLLDVSRLQTGKLNFNKEEFKLNELLRETVDDLQDTVKNKKINLEGKKVITVYGDKFRIYQVFTNLITNAAKYSPDRTDINVSIKSDAKKATVCVQDFGMGIAKQDQKKIFERLYQVTDPKEKTFSGLGMGLYISKEIIKRHRGSIWVESEKGKGSSFYFSLPLRK